MKASDFGDLVLNHFASVEGEFCFVLEGVGWCAAAAATVVLGSQFALLRKTRVVPERPKWSHCAGELAVAF